MQAPDCEFVKTVASAFCAQQLSPEDEDKVGEHIKVCADCHAVVQSMSRVWGLLELWEVPKAPKTCEREFHNRLSQMAANRSGSNGLRSIWNRIYLPRRFAAIPGVAMIAVVAFLTVLLYSHRSTLPPQHGAEIMSTAEMTTSAAENTNPVSVPPGTEDLNRDEHGLSPYVRTDDSEVLPLQAQEYVGVIVLPEGQQESKPIRSVHSEVLRVVPAGYDQ